jgi:hypothetical protein
MSARMRRIRNIFASASHQPTFLDTLRLGLDLLRVCSSSRNSSASLSDLAASVWSCRLPQFDRVSLGVMQAGKPSDAGIRFRVNLNLYPCSP